LVLSSLVNPLVAETITQSLINGTILEGGHGYYTGIMGPFFDVILLLVLFIPLIIRPQFAEFAAVAYILVGYAIADNLSGDLLRFGQIMMIVGLAGFFMKVFLGRDAY
jgi:hypothetical protein